MTKHSGASNISAALFLLASGVNSLAPQISRRASFGAAAATAAAPLVLLLPCPAPAAEDYSPKFVQSYGDFTDSPLGYSYKDVTVGSGDSPSRGDRAVFDWSGYTIGYFGRPFQAKGGPQGGAFDKDVDYQRTVVGSGAMVTAVEEALTGMKPGGVRQVVVPYGKLSYPTGDKKHEKVGPTPSTFSGMRALDFVLENPRVDRTLLFNLKLIRVDKSDGKGGFIKGKK